MRSPDHIDRYITFVIHTELIHVRKAVQIQHLKRVVFAPYFVQFIVSSLGSDFFRVTVQLSLVQDPSAFATTCVPGSTPNTTPANTARKNRTPIHFLIFCFIISSSRSSIFSGTQKKRPASGIHPCAARRKIFISPKAKKDRLIPFRSGHCPVFFMVRQAFLRQMVLKAT